MGRLANPIAAPSRRAASMGHHRFMKNSEHMAELVRRLMQARQERTPLVEAPAPDPILNLESAYEFQRLHTQAMLERFGGTVIGSKLGGTDLASMAALGLTGPYRGPIFSAFAQRSPAQLKRDDFFVCLVEVEVAALIGEDIACDSGPPDHAALLGAIGAVMPALEIVDSRYADFSKASPPALIADLAFVGAWVRGEEVHDWRSIDLSTLEVKLLSNGAEVRRGTGTRATGDPFIALSAMVADLGRRGERLTRGQVVTMGTYTLPYPVKQGEVLQADLGSLGTVSATFS